MDEEGFLFSSSFSLPNAQSPSSYDDPSVSEHSQRASLLHESSQPESLQHEGSEHEGSQHESDNQSESRVDDVANEEAALIAYRDTHPGKDQTLIGAREIDEHEAIWSVSSFRPHWGPERLRDNNPQTYWQGGNTYRDLQDLTTIECPESVGWLNVDLLSNIDGNPFRLYRLQIAILNTYSNGKDTHIRQLKIYTLKSSSYMQDHHHDNRQPIKRKPNLGRGLR
ncbi:hypothetical protein G6F29_006131 [Rhizopus arrhizus]|nr:hypothetical protein G6F22_015155 [Rhizopus arrhizus]KAG0838816.1 hypothetical protein G6F18_004353 [Rhizopus arrhizus]KAG0853011.1 hypothetical protein G6F17_007585 [Rhizopus arrhizus]KAG0887918.1 hypothetical protein G6F15_002033 [Rhizopus arrhizus]KAG0945614.1 hypothetical protein G6F30_004188 [Rhizopus arrhizus]